MILYYTLLTLGHGVFSDILAEGHHGLFYPLFSDSLQFLFRSDELFGEFAGILLAQYKIMYGINVLRCTHRMWSSAAWLAIHTGCCPYLAKQHIETIFIPTLLRELFD